MLQGPVSLSLDGFHSQVGSRASSLAAPANGCPFPTGKPWGRLSRTGLDQPASRSNSCGQEELALRLATSQPPSGPALQPWGELTPNESQGGRALGACKSMGPCKRKAAAGVRTVCGTWAAPRCRPITVCCGRVLSLSGEHEALTQTSGYNHL